MSKNLAARLAKLEAAHAPESSTRVLWAEENEDIAPRVAAMIAQGMASISDTFVRVGWLTAPESSAND